MSAPTVAAFMICESSSDSRRQLILPILTAIVGAIKAVRGFFAAKIKRACAKSSNIVLFGSF
jgi:hypothetical protein